MSTLAAPAPPPGARDRLIATLAYAAAVHVVLLLGLHLRPPAPAPAVTPPPLEIVLVRKPPPRAEPAPQQADYLAQSSHTGSGEQAEPAPAESRAAGVPDVVPAPPAPLPPAPAAPPAAAAPAPRPQITAPRGPVTAPPPQPQAEAPAPPLPTSAQLLAGAREVAELAARTGPRDRASAKHVRERYIDARTREYKYAAYLEAWRQKVETVGNLNYPARARELGLTGTLRLSVRVAADGSVAGITLMRSSGHGVLDDAAREIVRLAAPYAPFPDDIRGETDVLVITRTWQFLDNSLESR